MTADEAVEVAERPVTANVLAALSSALERTGAKRSNRERLLKQVEYFSTLLPAPGEIKVLDHDARRGLSYGIGFSYGDAAVLEMYGEGSAVLMLKGRNGVGTLVYRLTVESDKTARIAEACWQAAWHIDRARRPGWLGRLSRARKAIERAWRRWRARDRP